MIDQDDLERLITEAAELMQLRSGGGATCATSKAGRVAPATKDAEGRWAALRDVRAAVRGGRDGADAVAEVLACWEGHLDRLRSRDAGVDWLAYREGGVQALRALSPAPTVGR